jgi:hypothetical protein
MAELLTGRIYIIQSPNTEMVYIGSTTLSLKARFSLHVSKFKNITKSGSTSKFILEKGEAYIELIEEVEVESKRELKILEQKWIYQTPNTVNMNRAYVTDEERAQDHRDCDSKYRKEHQEKIAEKQKKYYEANREKILEIRKEWYQKNADELKEKEKKYREKNADKINEIIICTCGSRYTRHHKARHLRTQKHQKYLENLAQQ